MSAGGEVLPPPPTGGQQTCPAHGGPLVSGLIGRMIEIVGQGLRPGHIGAWFCLAGGCRYRMIEGGQ